MPLVNADRVKETSTTTGTGTYSLAGAATGFQTFVAGIGNGNTCYYCATDDTNWEVGIGTVTDATPDTLARTVILSSSNAGAAVNWGAGTRNIFCTQPGGSLGMVRLASGSVSAAATLDIVLTNYTAFRAIHIHLINWLPATNAVGLYMRTSTDGGSTFASSALNYMGTISSSTEIRLASSGAAKIGNGAAEGVDAIIEIPGQASTAKKPRITSRTLYYNADDSGATMDHGSYVRDAAQDTDAVRLFFSSGNITSGDYVVYGLI